MFLSLCRLGRAELVHTINAALDDVVDRVGRDVDFIRPNRRAELDPNLIKLRGIGERRKHPGTRRMDQRGHIDDAFEAVAKF